MKAILSLGLKDMRILWRDRAGVFWVIGFPFAMAIFFGSIFSGMGSDSPKPTIAIVDEDKTERSSDFIKELESAEVFRIKPMNQDSAQMLVRRGKLSAYIAIKEGFAASQQFGSNTSTRLEIGIDPARKATLGYLKGIVTATSFKLMQKQFMNPAGLQKQVQSILDSLSSTNESVPELLLLKQFFSSLDTLLKSTDSAEVQQNNIMSAPKINVVSITDDRAQPKTPYEVTFPSAILWALIGCSSSFAISIVKEKVRGTYSRLMVSPLSRAHILAGKGLACFFTCLIVCILLLTCGALFFGVRIDYPIKLAIAVLSAIGCFVGLMMLVSVLGKTEQSVGGIGWALMLIMAMTGGGMIPLFIMPSWMQTASNISPVKWGIVAIEGAIWRGYSYAEMLEPISILLGIGLVAYMIGVTILRRSDR